MWVIFFASAVTAVLYQTDPIATDRPDFTETSVVVPRGSTQIESGATYARDDGESVLSGPELLIRRGLSEKLELRVGLPDYQRPSTGPKGFDDLYLGFKVQLGPLRNGMHMALIPAVSIPIGRPGVRSEAASAELKVCWSRGLGEKSLSGMLAVASAREAGRWRTPIQHTLSLGIPVGEGRGIFLEHVIDAVEGSRPAHLFHTGFAWQPTPKRQFDLHLGLGLTREAPDYLLGVGYSELFGS